MWTEECQTLQKEWLNLAQSQLSSFVQVGKVVGSAIEKGKNIFAFGMGEDHWFAEELTSRLGGHGQIKGLFPTELMTYHPYYGVLREKEEYGKILLEIQDGKSGDVLITFSSSTSPLQTSVMEVAKARKMKVICVTTQGAKGIVIPASEYLAVYQVYAAQAINAASFAYLASKDCSEVLHQLNSSVLMMLEQWEVTQQKQFVALMDTWHRKQGKILIMGSGHPHMMADYFGTYPNSIVVPILEDELMVFDSSRSGWFQTMNDYAHMLINKYEITQQDIMIIPSNSGKSTMNIELARLLWLNRTTVVTLTNMRQSPVIRSEHASGRRLFETCDLVFDNCCPNKDTSIEIDSQRHAPLSSIITMLLAIQIRHQIEEVCQTL